MKHSSITSFNSKSASAPTKVPRPMNCFMTYRLEKQREIVQQCPGANHRDISKIIAKWWSELSPAEKEPYRLKAEKAKQEHNRLYPGYKFCPKKKASKPRAYKKRSENEFTARDFENKQQLFALYHEGKTTGASSVELGSNYLLDTKIKSDYLYANKPINKNKTLDHETSSSSSASYDENSNTIARNSSSPYDTDLLYPGNSNMYYSGSSVPSQSVCSPSTSHYTTGYSEEPTVPTQGDGVVNYNLYPNHYGYVESQAAAYPYQPVSGSVQYHYGSSPTSYYSNLKANYTTHHAYLHPLASRDTSPTAFVYNNAYGHTAASTSPALLTRPFYYQ